MENLGQISHVNRNIGSATTRAIKSFHLLVFEEEGDRKNRQRLRSFSGFDFSIDSDEYRSKLEFINCNLTGGDLALICNVLNLDFSGTISELSERICKRLIDINSLISNNDDLADDEQELSDAGSDENVQQVNANTEENRNNSFWSRSREFKSSKPTFHMSFRDIEDSIRPFNGEDNYTIEDFITDFEENKVLMRWDDLESFIFAKKSLRGLAKLFIQSERKITNWNSLKQALRSEFPAITNSAKLHEMLTKRKMKKDETVYQYLLAMKEIASRGSVDEGSLITYIIDGIQDDARNKAILFGVTTIKEFKQKLKIYEEIRSRSVSQYSMQTRWKTDVTEKGKVDPEKISTEAKHQRCFNCGLKGHHSKDCRSKNRGPKCFKCGNFGHKSHDCAATMGKNSIATTSTAPVKSITMSGSQQQMYKGVRIGNLNVEALIDTGSQVNLVREDVYHKIQATNLCSPQLTLTGFGPSNKVDTIGFFATLVTIDDNHFPTTMHVVPKEAMRMETIIGQELLNQAILNIDQNGIKIMRRVDDMFLHIEPIEVELDVEETVTEHNRKKVEQLMEDYKPEKIKTTDVEMRIIMKDEEPVYSRPRRLPFHEREMVEQQVANWIEDGIVEPCSSEWASPVVITRKKDGSPRLCIDFREVNKKVIKDRYPLPLIEDQLDRLQGAQYFSTIDLKNGFFHVAVEEGSRNYTTFVVHNGQYRFLKMPFGHCNSPSVFQRFINAVFRKLMNDEIVLSYMDDLIIPSKTEEEGIDKLKMVLNTSKDYGLEINKKKCQFLKRKVEFLGHLIMNGKILPSPSKTLSVVRFPKPNNIKQVQSFLGLTGYFRKFIPNYAKIAKPLSEMLKKNEGFRFNDEERLAFERLKSILVTKPVLEIYRRGLETELHTDASMEGYGAVLLQKSLDDNKLHPVHFMSKKTTDAEKKYTSYELEVLAIVQALKKFRVYLLGNKFKIVTDCAAFQKTVNKKDIPPRIARWALLLEEYDYTIEHRHGVGMKHVDALSRYPVMNVTIETNAVTIKLRNEQEKDETIRAIIEILKDKPYEDYFVRNNLLFKYVSGNELLVVPKTMQTEIVRRAHENGHFAEKKTREIIEREYYIPNLKAKVASCIRSCVPCILVNRKEGKKEGFLHPLHKGDLPLQTYHIDHLGPLESTNKNYKHILVIIDAFTKFVWLYPTKSTTTKEVISKLEQQKKTFGSPATIISDRGSAFTSTEFQEYCNNEAIQHHKITTGLPRANGQVERINRIIIPVLAKLSLEDSTKWYKHVDVLQQTLNSTYQRSVATTPFELLFGTKMHTKEDMTVRKLLAEEMIHEFENDREELRKEAKKQLQAMQEENKRYYNLRRRNPSRYRVNDLVAIKRIQWSAGQKLKPKFFGPYRVIKVKQGDTYDVVKESVGEGPIKTTTTAEFMKPWANAPSGSDE